MLVREIVKLHCDPADEEKILKEIKQSYIWASIKPIDVLCDETVAGVKFLIFKNTVCYYLRDKFLKKDSVKLTIKDTDSYYDIIKDIHGVYTITYNYRKYCIRVKTVDTYKVIEGVVM